MSHAIAIARTTSQRTRRHRRRPPPTPTTDVATTCVVLTGAPTADAARSTTAEPVSAARPSSGRSRKIRRPMVRTIGQPPSVVPAVSATAHASFTHVGESRLPMLPSASSTTATTPTDFDASFAP